jgi:hypothetical protein
LLVNDGKEKNEGDVRKILIARTVKLAKKLSFYENYNLTRAAKIGVLNSREYL